MGRHSDPLNPFDGRLKLFNAIISLSVLYGSSAWTMTKQREKRLQTAQRQMLRLVVQTSRRKDNGEELEDWVEWIRMATHRAEDLFQSVGGEACVTAQRRRKFRWAGHVARMTDNRWTVQILQWCPEKGERKVGRPMRRWTDFLDEYFAKEWELSPNNWIALAANREA